MREPALPQAFFSFEFTSEFWSECLHALTGKEFTMLFAYTLFGALLTVLLLVVQAKQRKATSTAFKLIYERKLVEAKQYTQQSLELTFVSVVLVVAAVLWLAGMFGLLFNR